MTKLDELRGTRKQWIESLQSALAALDGRLDELEDRLRDAGEVTERYADVVKTLRSARDAIARTIEQVRSAAEDAWVVFARQSERALEQLRSDAAVAEAELSAELAEARPSFVGVAAGLVDAWRGRLDTLRVQLELGRAEAGDVLDETWERAERRYGELRQKAESFRDDTAHTVDEMRDTLRAASGDLRDAFEKAASIVTQSDED